MFGRGQAAAAAGEVIRYTDSRGRPAGEGLRVVRRLEPERFLPAINAIVRQFRVADPQPVVLVECSHGVRLVTALGWIEAGLVGCLGAANSGGTDRYHDTWRGPELYYAGWGYDRTQELAMFAVAQSETWTSEAGDG